jgi:ATP-dependent DNA helicase PIF1
MHLVSFHQCSNIQNIENCPGVEESMLTAYFAQNRVDEFARGILYNDFLEFYN